MYLMCYIFLIFYNCREDGNITEEIKIVSEEVETLTHFSTFALSASSGTIRWHHLPGDFGEQTHNTKARAFFKFIFVLDQRWGTFFL